MCVSFDIGRAGWLTNPITESGTGFVFSWVFRLTGDSPVFRMGEIVHETSFAAVVRVAAPYPSDREGLYDTRGGCVSRVLPPPLSTPTTHTTPHFTPRARRDSLARAPPAPAPGPHHSHSSRSCRFSGGSHRLFRNRHGYQRRVCPRQQCSASDLDSRYSATRIRGIPEVQPHRHHA